MAILCFGILGLGVGVLTIVEIVNWRSRRSVITRSQLFVRVIGGIVLLVLLSKVLGGFLYVHPDRQALDVVLNYWAECVLLGWLMIGIAAIDLRLVMKVRRQNRRSLNDMAQQLMDSFRAEHAHKEAVNEALGPEGRQE